MAAFLTREVIVERPGRNPDRLGDLEPGPCASPRPWPARMQRAPGGTGSASFSRSRRRMRHRPQVIECIDHGFTVACSRATPVLMIGIPFCSDKAVHGLERGYGCRSCCRACGRFRSCASSTLPARGESSRSVPLEVSEAALLAPPATTASPGSAPRANVQDGGAQPRCRPSVRRRRLAGARPGGASLRATPSSSFRPRTRKRHHSSTAGSQTSADPLLDGTIGFQPRGQIDRRAGISRRQVPISRERRRPRTWQELGKPCSQMVAQGGLGR